MDGFQRVGHRIGKDDHETDRHGADLLALIYQILVDDSTTQLRHLGSEQPVSSIPLNSPPRMQESQT